jgi:hypothetical protein
VTVNAVERISAGTGAAWIFVAARATETSAKAARYSATAAMKSGRKTGKLEDSGKKLRMSSL